MPQPEHAQRAGPPGLLPALDALHHNSRWARQGGLLLPGPGWPSGLLQLRRTGVCQHRNTQRCFFFFFTAQVAQASVCQSVNKGFLCICSWVTGSQATEPCPNTKDIIQTAALCAGTELTTCRWLELHLEECHPNCLREPPPSVTCLTLPCSRAKRGYSPSSTGHLVSLSGPISWLKLASTMSVRRDAVIQWQQTDEGECTLDLHTKHNSKASYLHM